ncbi:hypothetical protein [Albirhodobacter sp. R86504]|uniref:hypothetical protein n=1 Tax=Albirhodobacter sp. R86504 TaxID=3093848 RepID=UPI0036718857
MTTQFSTTAFTPNEVPQQTPKTIAFTDLMASVANLIGAERDLEDVSYSQDPAYFSWMRDAELAHERVTDSLRHFHALPNDYPQDRPLGRMAQLIDAMLGHEEPGGARKLHRLMQMSFFTKFQVSGIGATAMHRNAMLIQARHLTTALAALPLFDGSSAPDYGDDPTDDCEFAPF